MKPVLHQGHGIHRSDENGREYEPAVERRPEEGRRQQDHRGATDHELHKAFHAGTIPQTDGIR